MDLYKEMLRNTKKGRCRRVKEGFRQPSTSCGFTFPRHNYQVNSVTRQSAIISYSPTAEPVETIERVVVTTRLA